MVNVVEFQNQVQNLIQEYGVNVTIYPRTHSSSSMTGDETLTSGTGVAHRILWNNKLWKDSRDKPGDFVGTDGTILTNGSVTINKMDLVLYAGSMYEVKIAEVKRWQGSGLYTFAGVYALNGS